MAVDLTGAVAAAVVALEPEQWTDAIGCTVDEYEACLVEWRPDMPLELVRSIKFRLHGALLEGVIALGRAIRANVEGRPRMSEVPKELQPLIATFEGLDFVDMVPPAMVERFVKALCDPYRREPQQSIQVHMLADFRNIITQGVARAIREGRLSGDPPECAWAIENAARRCAVKVFDQYLAWWAARLP